MQPSFVLYALGLIVLASVASEVEAAFASAHTSQFHAQADEASSATANLLFLQVREPFRAEPSDAPQPIKKALMNLAAIDQKLAEDRDVASDQQSDSLAAADGASQETGSQAQSDSSEASQPEADATNTGVVENSDDQFQQRESAEVVRQTRAEATIATGSPSASLRVFRHQSERMPFNPTLAAMQVAEQTMQLARQQESSVAVAFERPNAAAGNPDADVVSFGLFGKTFYGMDLQAQEYTIDSIMTLQWVDARAVALVPAGQDELTLPRDAALLKMWTPSVEIANRLAPRFDRISSSVTVSRDGTVTQVERTLAVIKSKLVLNDYPFDTQTLRFNIVSTTYMLNEVRLEPLAKQEFSGLRANFFEGEEYLEENFGVKVYNDVEGSMKKSRGSMEMGVKRSNVRFLRNFLLPALLYLMISCAVFWLPFSPTFVTPRVALSIFVLMVFSSLASSAHTDLPASAPYNWLDLMIFTIQLHMFAVVCLNVFTEICFHSMKCTVTAVHISNELKVIAPSSSALSMGAILVAASNPDSPLSLKAMTLLIPVMFFLFLLTYMSCCATTLNAEISRNKRAENMKSQEFANGNMGPLASSESLAPAPDNDGAAYR